MVCPSRYIDAVQGLSARPADRTFDQCRYANRGGLGSARLNAARLQAGRTIRLQAAEEAPLAKIVSVGMRQHARNPGGAGAGSGHPQLIAEVRTAGPIERAYLDAMATAGREFANQPRQPMLRQ